MSERNDCIFCRIADGAFGTEFVAQNEHAVAFRDIQPQAPAHLLVVPRRHIPGLRDLQPEDGEVAVALLHMAREVARSEGLLEGGYRVVTNDGADAGQTVFHLHFHVLGGRKLTGPLA
ncbi:MAG: histidine triad nucleotide-binding protein [Chloroflexota bacterium]